jgi:hypothetical protein
MASGVYECTFHVLIVMANAITIARVTGDTD